MFVNQIFLNSLVAKYANAIYPKFIMEYTVLH